MPDNALSLSQLEALLASHRAEHGDISAVLVVNGESYAIDGRNVNVAAMFGAQTLPEPVLAFGQQRSMSGRTTNTPGERYMNDAAPGEWNTDLSAAPEGETVDIWRRDRKQDTGYRDAANNWHAFEDGKRAWELAVPPLYWKPRT